MDNVHCLNPWDPQSKRQYMIDGVYATLNAGQAIGGQAHGICYCIEGNVVDRVSSKNGKGWCENVSPTLNTQDRHAVVFTIDAMSSNSMKSSNPYSGIHETEVSKCLDTMCLDPACNQGGCMVVYSVSCKQQSLATQKDIAATVGANDFKEPQSIVYALEGNGARPSHLGKGFSEDGTMYTLNTIEQHSVCYSVDCRNGCLNEELSITLQAKNQGGFSVNCTPPILRLADNESIRNREPSERQPRDDRSERDSPDTVKQDGNRWEQHAVRPHYFYESRYAEWKPYDVASVRESGGSCGNGSEGVVCSCVCDGNEPLERSVH